MIERFWGGSGILNKGWGAVVVYFGRDTWELIKMLEQWNEYMEEKHKIVRLRVRGMMCEGCTEAVSKKLLDVEGVEGVAVDLERSEARVQVVEGLHPDEHKLEEAVKEAGYEVEVIVE